MTNPVDSPLILHQYPASPFSEKVRLILGFKGLAWRAVRIPVVMPKPDLTALTGGHRRTPVLQRGADIYVDSALIAREIDRLAPRPSLYPAAAPLAPLLAQWADRTLFWVAVPCTLQPAVARHTMADATEAERLAFAADRAPFAGQLPRQRPGDAMAVLRSHLAALDAQLVDGRPWLFGDTPSIADFSVGHVLWFVHRAGPLAALVDTHAALAAWLQRLQAFGHGTAEPMDAAEALALAAGATPHAAVAVQAGQGFEAGEAVRVAAFDYGSDPVEGHLVGLDDQTIVLRREDSRAGVLHVHFPRDGFHLKKERPA